MYIKSEKAKVTEYCGIADFDSEIELIDGEKIIYINAHYGEDCTTFIASPVSIFEYLEKDVDDMLGLPEYLEEFEEFKETENSKYAKFYKIADRMIDDLADSYKNQYIQ